MEEEGDYEPRSGGFYLTIEGSAYTITLGCLKSPPAKFQGNGLVFGAEFSFFLSVCLFVDRIEYN